MSMTPPFKKWKKSKIILPSLRTLLTQIPGKTKPLWHFVFSCSGQPWSTSSLKHGLSWSSYRECSRQGNVNTAFNLEDDDGKWQPDVWHLCLKSVYSKPKLIKPNPLQLTNVFWGFCGHKKGTAPPPPVQCRKEKIPAHIVYTVYTVHIDYTAMHCFSCSHCLHCLNSYWAKSLLCLYIIWLSCFVAFGSECWLDGVEWMIPLRRLWLLEHLWC